jgi:CMP-N,N'-diacetyllegionaminic acid synthase
MRILYLIAARAGSKGLPGKNTKMLGGKPLIQYSVEFAMNNMKEGDEICVSSNDQEVLNIASDLGISIPFKRPEELSTDTSSSYDVILHAIKFYENQNKHFDSVVLLQPTSPFRKSEDLQKMILSYKEDVEMVVTVKNSKENPYFTLFEENESGFLKKSKEGYFDRRQDCPKVFAFNGSIYLYRISSLKEKKVSEFTKIKKVVMPEERSIDIDTMADWILAEYYLDKQ